MPEKRVTVITDDLAMIDGRYFDLIIEVELFYDEPDLSTGYRGSLYVVDWEFLRVVEYRTEGIVDYCNFGSFPSTIKKELEKRGNEWVIQNQDRIVDMVN